MTPLDAGVGGDDQVDATVQPDPCAMRVHLDQLFRRIPDEYPGGLIEIAWSDRNGDITSANLFEATPEGIAKAIACAVSHNTDDLTGGLNGRNVYVGVNPRKPGTKRYGRASGNDVEIALFCFADCDGPPSTDRLLKAPLPYSFALTTGVVPEPRAHPYWELEEPTRDMVAWSAQQAALAEHFGSDKITDPPRIMRLAGTISYPPERKRARGYVTEPTMIRTIYPDENDNEAERAPVAAEDLARAYSSAATPSDPFTEFDNQTLSKLGRKSDEQWFAEIRVAQTGKEWRDAVLAFVGSMINRGLSDAVIFALGPAITMPGYTVEQTRKDLSKIISYTRKNWSLPNPDGSAGNADTAAAVIAEFNARYMVVNETGKAIVYEPMFDPRLNRRHFVRITFDDLKRLYLNRRLPSGAVDKKGKPIIKSAAEIWLGAPDRRQYIGGVVFDPSGKNERPDVLNLWDGYAVEPKPGSWRLLKEHLAENICNGNPEHFKFLMGWMARMIQYPAEQGEVAVVLKGGEGIGKGTVARALLHILGQHGLAISNAKHLVGAFNNHLRDTVFLFADEAFFAGDRAHVGVLKALITEPFIMVEGKYRDAFQAANHVHLLMASNETWVVPASMDARRFFVLVVSHARANDLEYFSAIWAEMEAGGYQAMLHDLLNYDLTDYNPRRIPVTAGLIEQRKLSLPVPEDWWRDVLYRGYVFASRLGQEDFFGSWHDKMSTEVLFDSYTTHAKARGERHPMSREELGKFMIKMGAKPARLRDAVVGEHIKDDPLGGRSAELVTVERAHGYLRWTPILRQPEPSSKV